MAIDINELRKVIADCYWPTSPVTIKELLDRLEAAEKDIARKEKVIDALGSELNAAANERDDVAQQLVQSEIGKREISEAHNAVTRRLSALADENAALIDDMNLLRNNNMALRAKIEAMEKQEPVAWQTRTRPAWNDGTWGPWRKCSEEYAEDIKNTPLLHDWLYEARTLYTLPGAQQCKNCNGMGDRFDPSGEKIPCDLCESRLEEIRSLVAEAAHDIISGSDFWLSISLAAKKLYALPGAKGE